MSTNNDDLDAISDAFSVHLKSNKHGNPVLNTKDATVRAAWKKLSDGKRVAAKLKLRRGALLAHLGFVRILFFSVFRPRQRTASSQNHATGPIHVSDHASTQLDPGLPNRSCRKTFAPAASPLTASCAPRAGRNVL